MQVNPDKPTHTNRLAQETSPYLLQHAHNPVDWYAWGEEAFERAKRENKPIFLSVGYSTCYWCHVMERQSFENEAIAAVMNEHFINIKVDREERPDVDQLYMTAVQVLTRHGGWPMSVWLTPDLRPFYGGTYFPPADMHGRPGFVTVLKSLDDAYKNRKTDVEQSAGQLKDILEQLAEPNGSASSITIDEKTIETLIDRSTSDYDPDHGGFGAAPKFPRETFLELLLVYLRGTSTNASAQSQIANRKSKIQGMVHHALDTMALGGIRDQLGGGFHRYSTDAKWLVPHFEIMLYDNAMLGWCYAEAIRQTNDGFYTFVARGVFDFVLREMTSPDGAFYTALDAEVDAQEGMPYLWTADEVRNALVTFPEADIERFLIAYGLDKGPNFADPHHSSGMPDKNVLFVADRDLIAAHDGVFVKMRYALKRARDVRKQPMLDTKIITSWNALMIRALAFGGAALKEPRYVEAASRAATFLLETHRNADGRLFRASRDGKAKYQGFLDDYAYLVDALLALRDATHDEAWLVKACDVAGAMQTQFGDATNGGYYFSSADAKDLIVRQKVASDSPLPSGNAVAAMALLKMGEVDEALRTIGVFATQLRQQSEGMSSMVQAALIYVRQHGPLIVEPVRTTATIERPLSPEQVAAGVVTLRAEKLSPTEILVHLDILRGFHINTNTPAPGLIATTLNVTGSEVESIYYPPGQSRELAYANNAVQLYEGSTTFRVKLRTPLVGEARLSVTYQACDASACLPPTTKGISI